MLIGFYLGYREILVSEVIVLTVEIESQIWVASHSSLMALIQWSDFFRARIWVLSGGGGTFDQKGQNGAGRLEPDLGNWSEILMFSIYVISGLEITDFRIL